MAFVLRLRTKTKPKTFPNPPLLHLSSTTKSNSSDDDQTPAPTNSHSLFPSYFRHAQQPQPSTPPPLRFNDSSNQTSLQDIRRKLSEFRRRTTVPSPRDPSSTQQISFQELYKRSILQHSTTNADSGPAKPGSHSSLNAIGESWKQIGGGGGGGDRKGVGRISLTAFKDVLKLKPSEGIDESGALPESVFGKEMKEKRDGDSASPATKT